MNIEKIKEVLIAAKAELPELSSAPLGKEPQAIHAARLVKEALAELEKPAEEDLILMCAEEINGGCLVNDPIPYDRFIPLARRIQLYAEFYHNKKETARVLEHGPLCAFCNDPITIGVCENCVPDMFNNDNTPKTGIPHV